MFLNFWQRTDKFYKDAKFKIDSNVKKIHLVASDNDICSTHYNEKWESSVTYTHSHQRFLYQSAQVLLLLFLGASNDNWRLLKHKQVAVPYDNIFFHIWYKAAMKQGGDITIWRNFVMKPACRRMFS